MALSKNVVLLLFLYFIQGLPYGFQASFLPTYLYSQGVSLSSIGLLKLVLVPWLCKALWAPLVDRWGTKHGWLLWSVGGLVITCAIAAIAVHPEDITALALTMLALNFCAATQDIAVDAIAVALLEDSDVANGNTAQVVGYKIGSVFGGGILVWFIDALGWSGLFGALTILYVEAWMFVYVSPSLRELDARMKQAANPVFDYAPINKLKWDQLENNSVFTNNSSSSSSLFPEQSLRNRKVVNQYDTYKEYYKEDDVNTSDDDFPDSAKTLHARLIQQAKYRKKQAMDEAMRVPDLTQDNKSANCDQVGTEPSSCVVKNQDMDGQIPHEKVPETVPETVTEKVTETTQPNEETISENHQNDLFSKLRMRHNVPSSDSPEDKTEINHTKETAPAQATSIEPPVSDESPAKRPTTLPLPPHVLGRSQLNSEEYVADDENDSSSDVDQKVTKESRRKKTDESKSNPSDDEEEEEEEEKGSSVILDDEEEEDDTGVFSIFQKTLEVPGTKWLLVLLLIYKLGEQGALNLVPPFLVDQNMKLNDVTFWKGLMGQGFGIVGSLIGGWLMTKFDVPIYLLLQQLCLLRLLPIGGLLLVITLAPCGILATDIIHYLCVLLLIVLLVLGGAVTTVTFALMMFVSRRAHPRVQATHYTLAATVEVLGKLSFSSLVLGTVVERVGFAASFGVLVALAVAVVPWFARCPEEVALIGCGGAMGEIEGEGEMEGEGDGETGDGVEEEEAKMAKGDSELRERVKSKVKVK